MSRPLPDRAWEALFPRAPALIDEVRTHGGITAPHWTLGGGTILMIRFGHRLSKNIDIFVRDARSDTYLGA